MRVPALSPLTNTNARGVRDLGVSPGANLNRRARDRSIFGVSRRGSALFRICTAAGSCSCWRRGSSRSRYGKTATLRLKAGTPAKPRRIHHRYADRLGSHSIGSNRARTPIAQASSRAAFCAGSSKEKTRIVLTLANLGHFVFLPEAARLRCAPLLAARFSRC
jgi:hypothetical protein